MADRDDFGVFLIGFIVGGVAGAVAALLLAPQSGEETRTQIKEKSIELREKAVQTAEQAKVKAGEIAGTARLRGKEVLESVKKAVTKKGPTPTETTPAA